MSRSCSVRSSHGRRSAVHHETNPQRKLQAQRKTAPKHCALSPPRIAAQPRLRRSAHRTLRQRVRRTVAAQTAAWIKRAWRASYDLLCALAAALQRAATANLCFPKVEIRSRHGKFWRMLRKRLCTSSYATQYVRCSKVLCIYLMYFYLTQRKIESARCV